MEERCRWHPSHKQSRGVCPSCLRERLSRTLATVSAASSSNNTSSPYSSGATPSWCDGSSAPGRSESMLKRSMSMACVLGMDAVGRGARGKRGGRGFWRRLLGMEWRRKEEEVKDGKMVLHSQTVKSTSARWLF